MVGSAVRKSGIRRDELFITSKLCQARPSYAQAKENVKGSLRRMKLDYLDIMLVHCIGCKTKEAENQIFTGSKRSLP